MSWKEVFEKNQTLRFEIPEEIEKKLKSYTKQVFGISISPEEWREIVELGFEKVPKEYIIGGPRQTTLPSGENCVLNNLIETLKNQGREVELGSFAWWQDSYFDNGNDGYSGLKNAIIKPKVWSKSEDYWEQKEYEIASTYNGKPISDIDINNNPIKEKLYIETTNLREFYEKWFKKTFPSSYICDLGKIFNTLLITIYESTQDISKLPRYVKILKSGLSQNTEIMNYGEEVIIRNVNTSKNIKEEEIKKIPLDEFKKMLEEGKIRPRSQFAYYAYFIILGPCSGIPGYFSVISFDKDDYKIQEIAENAIKAYIKSIKDVPPLTEIPYGRDVVGDWSWIYDCFIDKPQVNVKYKGNMKEIMKNVKLEIDKVLFKK